MQRFSAQIVLPEIGKAGQEKLAQAKVLVVGAGGLGSPALTYLAAAGIGKLGIIDSDRVDLSNLQRQILFTEKDIGRPKVECAQERLSQINSAVEIQTYFERLGKTNVEKILKNYDVILDGSDNFNTKFLLNDTCIKENKPWVYGAVLKFRGEWGSFWAQRGPCYRCLYPQPPQENIDSCQAAGVLGMVAGIVGNFQALMAIKILLDPQYFSFDSLYTLEAWNSSLKKITLTKNPACAVCALVR